MARVVQCPACGETHPLDTLAGTPTFSCNGCGRTLRTPTELVRPSGATPVVRAAPKSTPSSGRTAAARSAAPRPTSTRSERAPSPARPPRPRRPRTGKLALPVRIGAWVVAVLFGLLLTWLVASAIGFLSRSQLVDMFRSSTPGNYIRLFLLIPVWAFMSACLATAFIEGTRVFLARRAGAPAEENAPRAPKPALATRVPDVDAREPEREPEPPRAPLTPGQRTRIRPREPTV